MSVTSYPEKFSKNITTLLTLIYNTLTGLQNQNRDIINPNIISLASSYINAIDKLYLLQNFITHTHHQCWDWIANREEQIICDNSQSLFSFLPQMYVEQCKNILFLKDRQGKDIITNDIKAGVWAGLDSQVKVCIKYIHENRKPYATIVNGQLTYAYGCSFFDDVDLAYHAEKWKITEQLTFPTIS